MKTCLFAAFATLALAATAHADSIIKNFSTGYDDANNVQLSDGVIDTDWSIVSGGTAGHVGDPLTTIANNLPGPYLADNASADSRWIALYTGVESFGITTDPGTYKFQTSVNIAPGTDLSMVVIPTLRFAVDDNVLDISINGVSVYSHNDCGCSFDDKWTTLSCVGAGLFQDGNNNITFTVVNDSDYPNPMALRVEGDVAVDCACASGAPVPEPASLSLLGLGAVALLTRRRK